MYLKFYQLIEEPFCLTPDPRFLHLAQPYRDALGEIVQSILRRKGILVLTGPIGTGKTTLLHAAMRVLESSKEKSIPLASAFVLNPLLSREEFLETLMHEYEVPCASASKPARLAALHKMFLEKQQQGGTSLLIVDEAHLLTPELLEEIRLLSNTDTYREKLLQVVLCGQPELTLLLQRREMRALQQRITQYCSLRALTLPEIRSYVAERLHAAGLRGPSPFATTAIETVHRFSHGVPRLINQVCDTALSLGFASRREVVQSDLILEAANQLHMTEEQLLELSPPVEPPVQPRVPLEHVTVPRGGPGPRAETRVVATNQVEVAAVQTAVDLIIDALRHRRATALE